MIPDMPTLIPTNGTIEPSNIPDFSNQFNYPLQTQSPPQPSHEQPNDYKDKGMDDQIQLIKQIQQILATEQKKLEILLKLFHERKYKREQMTHSYFYKNQGKKRRRKRRKVNGL